MNRFAKLFSLVLCGLFLVLPLVSCSSQDEVSVGNCGGHDILYDELRFHAMAYLDKYKDCTDKELKDGVSRIIARQYALLDVCIGNLPDISFEGKEMDELVEDQIKSAKKTLGGKAEYKDYLSKMHLTDSLIRRQLAIAQMQVELEKVLFKDTYLKDEKSFIAWLDDGNFVRVKEVFFPSETLSLSDALVAARMLKSGIPVDELLKPEQKQKGAEVRPAQFYYRDLNGTEAERAALSLKHTGDSSEVITLDSGYLILVRVEDQREVLVDYQLSAALQRYRSAQLDKMVDEILPNYTPVWNDLGKDLDWKNLD